MNTVTNFFPLSIEDGHVIPGLIHKCYLAKKNGSSESIFFEELNFHHSISFKHVHIVLNNFEFQCEIFNKKCGVLSRV